MDTYADAMQKHRNQTLQHGLHHSRPNRHPKTDRRGHIIGWGECPGDGIRPVTPGSTPAARARTLFANRAAPSLSVSALVGASRSARFRTATEITDPLQRDKFPAFPFTNQAPSAVAAWIDNAYFAYFNKKFP
jgi:hypothetical protein